jgi:Protein of unknown function (DUF3800)
MNKLPKKYIFIDESGDAAFYANRKKLLVGTEGFQPLLMLGMVMIEEKTTLYNTISSFQESIKNDSFYNTLSCVTDPKGWYLHARADHTDIKAKFVELLRQTPNYKTFVVIGRKRLSTFQNKHNSKESEFYFDLIYHLLKDRLNDDKYFYQIILAGRTGSNVEKLKSSIEKAIARDNDLRVNKLEIQFDCRTSPSNSTPELSIVDYLLWALQRYILTNDARYYRALEGKYDSIIDLYETDKDKNGYYNQVDNPFDKEKASEFRKDGYV